MKKITEKDIADSLGISRVSVWKVFNGKSGTSAEMRQKVMDKARELGYPIPNNHLKEQEQNTNTHAERNSIQHMKTIAVAVSRPETSVFWMNILHEIAKNASKQNYNLLYIYLPTDVSANYQLPAQFFNGSVDGFIVLNIYNELLLKLLNQLPIPKVFLDTTPSFPMRLLNGDLLLIDGLSEIKEITLSLIQQGITKIGFIGDITYALTNYERYSGYMQAMQECNLTVNPNFCLTKAIENDTYTEEIDEFLNRLTDMPEAFICASDYVANILWNHLEQRGYHIPQDILISGFDGNTEITHNNELTTVHVDTKLIGVRLAIQLFYRMKYPDSGKEFVYVRPNVKFSLSTQAR